MTQTHPRWPPGGGEMATRIRDFDWATTPLGAIAAWSPRLTLMVEMVLASPQIATLACGSGLTLLYNDAATRLYGELHPGALGRPLPETFPAGWAVVSGFYDRAFQGETVQIAAQPLDTRGEGNPAADVFDALLLPVREMDGRIAYVHMTGTEVGRRRRAEAALRESDERLHVALASADLGTFVWHVAENRTEEDARARTHFGLPPDGTVSLAEALATTVHPDDGPRYAAAVARAIDPAGPGTLHEEYRIRHPDGQERWMSTRAIAAFAGTPRAAVRLTGVLADITDRKRAEAALQASQEQQAFLLTLSDTLRPLAEPLAIQAVATRLLGEHLKVDRAYYVEINESRGVASVGQDYVANQAPSLVGAHPIASFSWSVDILRRGACHVVADTQGSPVVPAADRAALAALRIMACMGAPLIKAGTLVGALCVTTSQARSWVRTEVELLQAVGERIWSAIERAGAEAALRASEEGQAFLLRLSDALRPLDGPTAVQTTAMTLLAERLNVMRASYYELEEDWDSFHLTARFESRAAPIPERMRLSDFSPALLDAYTAGRTLAVSDTAVEGAFVPDPEAYARIGVGAWAAVPLVRNGRLVAWLGVHSATARAWSPADLRTLEDVAERTWSAVARARAEQAFIRSETKYRVLFDSIDEGFCIIEMLFDDDGNAVDYTFLESNPVFEKQAGFKIARGQRIREIAPEHEQYWFDVYGRIALTGEPERFENEAAAFGIFYDVYAFRVDDPALRRVAVLFRDITEAKRAERALRESEVRFRALATAGAQTIYRMSPDWQVMHQLEGGTLAPTTDPIEQWVDKYILPEDRPEVNAVIAEAIRTKSMFELEHRVQAADGDVTWVLSRAVPILGEDGAIAEWFGAAADVSARKEAEAALRESEKRLRGFGDASQDVLWIREAETLRWTYLTPAFETIYGLGREEALTGDDFRNWTDLILPEDRDKAVANIRKAREGERVTFEYRIRRPRDGEIRWMRDTDFPILDDAGHVASIGGVGTDVTAEKQSAERMEVLVGELQHRTRNLMGVVRATADKTLRASTDLADFAARYTTRLAALSRVQSLLSRLGEGERITFDELIRSEVAAHDGGTGKVKLHGPSGVALRSSTFQTFALALHELATNALKYGALAQGQGEARLEIRWRLEHAEPEREPSLQEPSLQEPWLHEPWLHVDWRERGVILPADGGALRTGSGRELIERALPYQLGARTTYVMEADGVHCIIALPVSGRGFTGRTGDA